MEYLIWGAGRTTYMFINEHYSIYFYRNPIVAIVDNNSDKWGSKFLGYPVIAPEDIKTYSFDRILLCSHYDDVIIQITKELRIGKDKIIVKEDVIKEIYSQLVNEHLIFEKKILIVGSAEEYVTNDGFLNLIGFVDYRKLDVVKQYSFDYILLTNLMNTPMVCGTDTCRMLVEEKFIENLKNYGIERNKILTNVACFILRDRDYLIPSRGKENADKTFLIQKLGGGGLGAIVETVAICAEYAKRKGYILVIDGQFSGSQYLEQNEIGKVNAWEKFFEQPCGYTLSDIQNSKNIIVRWKAKRGQATQLDFLRMQPELKEQVEQGKRIYLDGNKVLGVLFRGSDYANRKPYNHNIQPDLSVMLDTVSKKMVEWGGFDKIFLATEVKEVVETFQKRFSDKVICYPQNRVPMEYDKYLATYKFNEENDAYKRGADYWTILNILADCDSLIAGRTGGSKIAELLNKNRYTNKFIFDLGKYGIDDR